TIWWDNTWALIGSLIAFASAYVWLYARLVSWRRPGWLLLPSVIRND
ncbi:MAG: glycosyl transferase, partial [Alcaligenaceae bacterium]